MSEKQYVQHISGQGEKWPVRQEMGHAWGCLQDGESMGNLVWLPKSEYRLCDPPEVWRDVSEGVRVGSDLSCILYDNLGREISVQNGYRLRKVQAYQVGERAHVFIVEQKVKS